MMDVALDLPHKPVHLPFSVNVIMSRFASSVKATADVPSKNIIRNVDCFYLISSLALLGTILTAYDLNNSTKFRFFAFIHQYSSPEYGYHGFFELISAQIVIQ
jgi:hypothetical protein